MINVHNDIISCSDCDHYTTRPTMLDEGDCFLGTIEDDMLVELVVPKTNCPCGHFTWKVDDKSFESEA